MHVNFIPTDALGLHYVGGADKLKSSFFNRRYSQYGGCLVSSSILFV